MNNPVACRLERKEVQQWFLSNVSKPVLDSKGFEYFIFEFDLGSFVLTGADF